MPDLGTAINSAKLVSSIVPWFNSKAKVKNKAKSKFNTGVGVSSLGRLTSESRYSQLYDQRVRLGEDVVGRLEKLVDLDGSAENIANLDSWRKNLTRLKGQQERVSSLVEAGGKIPYMVESQWRSLEKVSPEDMSFHNSLGFKLEKAKKNFGSVSSPVSQFGRSTGSHSLDPEKMLETARSKAGLDSEKLSVKKFLKTWAPQSVNPMDWSGKQVIGAGAVAAGAAGLGYGIYKLMSDSDDED